MSAVHLDCCVCGGSAGKYKQHHNRDEGYGICATCAAEQRSVTSPEDMLMRYGVERVNYSPAWYKHFGLYYRVVAIVRPGPKQQELANEFMSKFPGTAVLAVQDWGVVIVRADDLGSKEKV